MATKSQLEGESAEKLFIDICKENGLYAFHSGTQKDMINHIDFLIFTEREDYWSYKAGKPTLVTKVDVKGEKRFNRGDYNYNPNLTWLEYTNVNGDIGWLRGDATYIAFLNKGSFDIVNRIKLLEHYEKNVSDNPIKYEKTECKHYDRYQRKNWNRKDILISIPYDVITELKDFTLNKLK